MDKERFKQKQEQIIEFIKSDKIIKDLYSKLHRLHSSYTPKFIVVDGEMHAYYSDKFKRLESSIHEEIEHRQEQITNYYKPLWEILNNTEENK